MDPPSQAAPPRPSLPARLALAAADIKIAHSIFALPFAVLGAFMARPEGSSWQRFAGQLAIVVACMVLARTWAMLVNRLADRDIDAANPRTQRRVIASGRLSARDGLLVALACAAGFIACAALFWVFFANFWPLALSVPVLVWIAFYSFTKRFTALCHVFLGGALAASPLAAAIAIDPGFIGASAALWLLAGMVLLWVAGFDVIYALQDVEFDRSTGLHSVPARLGPIGAIWVSRLLHAGAFALLCLAARAEPRFGPVFGIAVAAVGVLLVVEHVVLAKRGKAGLDMAFFTINGIVSCVLGAAGVVDLAWL
ncbi:MAG: putative 4-hydroxybenzoate polyprenyltransferase [Phycisphaeraceae bacterium]|nr:putative 4-hydroxybenzoate polyprenyltransferase [Phycisphaeraceae bacterium]